MTTEPRLFVMEKGKVRQIGYEETVDFRVPEEATYLLIADDGDLWFYDKAKDDYQWTPVKE
jgi:hypothetical protein